MYATLVPLGALLSGVAVLWLGTGLLGTLLGVRGSLEGFGDQMLGLIMSGYFLGFLLGPFLVPAAIGRMGHIRAFSFFSAVFTCTVLLHAMWIHPVGWGLLRIATGVAVVGLYTVIESWLSEAVDRSKRGRVFAVYMVITLAALASGQQLLRLAPVESFVLFSLAAILVCAAMLPVAATRMVQPVLQPAERVSIGRLVRFVPAAAAGALFSGVAIGTFWGLGPVYASRLGLGIDELAIFMTMTIAGGAVLQWPIGLLSDSGDRRRTLALACTGAGVAAGVAALLTGGSTTVLYVVFFFYGGLSFAIYPVAMAHLLDHVDAEDVLAACSTVLLLHGVGAVLGPALAGFLMQNFGARAFPAFLMVAQLLLGAYVFARLFVRQRESMTDSRFHPMLRTTPTAMELLPESDVVDEETGQPR